MLPSADTGPAGFPLQLPEKNVMAIVAQAGSGSLGEPSSLEEHPRPHGLAAFNAGRSAARVAECLDDHEAPAIDVVGRGMTGCWHLRAAIPDHDQQMVMICKEPQADRRCVVG